MDMTRKIPILNTWGGNFEKTTAIFIPGYLDQATSRFYNSRHMPCRLFFIAPAQIH
jgi:hypothetical protein